MDKPDNLCMAPWTHTYLSPQTERRLCCASREPAQNFRQYIDTSDGTNEYMPQTLEEWWNGEHIRRVRRQMLAGELPPECEVCDKKLLNTDVYRDYFWHLFKHKYDDIARQRMLQAIQKCSLLVGTIVLLTSATLSVVCAVPC